MRHLIPGARAVWILTLAPLAPAQQTWHVRAGAPPGGNGQTWSTAFDSVQDALDVAVSHDQVWVARGRYHPERLWSPGDARSATFWIPAGVGLFGGFDGTEPTLAARAGLFAQTVLSGDVGVPGDDSDNAYHVVLASQPAMGASPFSVVDGFAIQDGNADGSVAMQQGGGGVRSDNAWLLLSNCTLRGNAAFQGGGLYQSLGTVRVKWCTFEANAALKGGAVYTRYAALFLANSVLRGNTASKEGGGAYVHSSGGLVLFTSCELHDNAADLGGAVYLKAPGPNTLPTATAWVNDTVAFNSASTAGGAFYEEDGGATPAQTRVVGSILWSNAAPVGAEIEGSPGVVEQCTVTGGYPGANLDLDPLFADGPARDLRILPRSPCVDAANNNFATSDLPDLDEDGNLLEPLPLDLGRRPRYADHPGVPNTGQGNGPLMDMGAHEVQVDGAPR